MAEHATIISGEPSSIIVSEPPGNILSKIELSFDQDLLKTLALIERVHNTKTKWWKRVCPFTWEMYQKRSHSYLNNGVAGLPSFDSFYAETQDALELAIEDREKLWIPVLSSRNIPGMDIFLPTLAFVFKHKDAKTSQFSRLLMREYYRWREKLIMDWYMMAPFAHRHPWTWITIKGNVIWSKSNHFNLPEDTKATTLIKRLNFTDAFFMKTPTQIKSFLKRFPMIAEMKPHGEESITYREKFADLLLSEIMRYTDFIQKLTAWNTIEEIDARFWELFLIKLDDREYTRFINEHIDGIKPGKVKSVQLFLKNLVQADLTEFLSYSQELLTWDKSKFLN